MDFFPKLYKNHKSIFHLFYIEENKLFKLMIYLFIYLQLVDISSTYIGLNLGLTELNPIAQIIIKYSWSYAYLTKGIILFFVITLMNLYKNSEICIKPIYSIIPLIVLNIIMFITVLNNCYWLKVLLWN